MILTIDPGISGTGYAIWTVPEWGSVVIPAYSGVCWGFKEDEGDWLERSQLMVDAVHKVTFNLHDISKVIVEFPEYQSGAVGHTSARKGDTLKLAAYCGMLHSLAGDYNAKVEFVSPSKWKGQLPKAVVEQRIKDLYRRELGTDNLPFKAHAWDAVGIGLWAKGFINQ